MVNMKPGALTPASLLRHADAAGYAFAGADEDAACAPERRRRFPKAWLAVLALLAALAALAFLTA